MLEVREDPPKVADHDVPVIVSAIGLPRPDLPQVDGSFDASNNTQSPEHTKVLSDKSPDFDKEADWDLTTKQVLEF